MSDTGVSWDSRVTMTKDILTLLLQVLLRLGHGTIYDEMVKATTLDVCEVLCWVLCTAFCI